MLRLNFNAKATLSSKKVKINLKQVNNKKAY